MSSKQMKKLIGIIVGFVVVAVIVVCAFLFVDFESLGGTVDIETIKAEGNYEQMKADFITNLKMRDGQAAAAANLFFEDLGITSYEGMTMGGRRGIAMVNCDGYALDCFFVGGQFANAYIGNAIVFKNDKVTSTTVSDAPTYTFTQYDTIVKSFQKDLGVSEEAGKALYEQLTLMDVNSFTNIKSGKVNGIKGYFGYESEFPYFITLNEDETLKTLSIVCDGFDPIEVYNSSIPNDTPSAKTYKVLFGGRTTLPDGLSYQVGKAMESTVTLPAALADGSDSWLMVKNNGQIYIEVSGEVLVKEEKKVQDFVMKLNESDRSIIYLKAGKKVYIGAE